MADRRDFRRAFRKPRSAPAALAMLGLLGIMSIAEASGSGGSETVTALKAGNTVYFRTSFSEEEDVLITVGKGTNKQISFIHGALLPSNTPMEEEALKQAQRIFHYCGDDAAPWNVNGTYIGGNHGASDVISVSSSTHGLNEDDLGSAWEDEKGIQFHLIELQGPDRLLFLSNNTSPYPYWNFQHQISGRTLINTATGASLAVESTSLTQLWPACRIEQQRYLANGITPLEDGVPVECHYVDILEEYDIIAPDAVLAAVKGNPGRKTDFVASSLEGVIRNRIRYRYLPRGACVIRHQATALRDFKLGYMGFIQSAPLQGNPDESLDFYIPKTAPFEADDEKYDFQGIQDFSKTPKRPLTFSLENRNILSPADMPDRFVQFIRTKDSRLRRIGHAFGYSLVEGLTRPDLRALNTNSPFFIHTTNKAYPKAIDQRMAKISKGDELECIAYRQYFNPAAYPEATALYGHLQGEDYFVYADFHQPIDHFTVPVPRQYIGAQYEVVEKTPSVRLGQGNTVSTDGIGLSVQGSYGRIVLRVIGKPDQPASRN